MRLTKVGALTAAATALGLVTVSPAFAQKSKDTLRFAVSSPFASLSPFHTPTDESGMMFKEIYEQLLAYDEYNKKFVPQLAKAWTVKPGVYEFELKEGIKFHNGNPFDADDVVTTLKYLSDPATKLSFKNRYDWIKDVEKLGPYRVRITAIEPSSLDISLLAYRIRIWDGETMGKYANVEDYGRLSPVGTGIYKAIQVDKNTGTIIERYDGYNTDPLNKASIARFHGIPIPDQQTQVAQFLTGGVDLLRNISPDIAKDLAKSANAQITNIPAPNIFYLSLDAAGASGNKALSDKRVRRAIFMAIDRDALIKHLVPGDGTGIKMDALCFEKTIDCKYDVKAPSYDPAAAKKLLAEAGYPNGLEFEYNVYAPYIALGQAIAGDLLKVGVKANIQSVDLAIYRKKQGAGELQGLSVMTPTAGHPEASAILGTFFTGPAEQYYRDTVIAEAFEKGSKEFDQAKRQDYYARAFNRANEESYVFPVSSIPNVLAHTKEIGVKPDKYATGDVWTASYYWK